jgi:CRISPR-associated endonuclease Csn1
VDKLTVADLENIPTPAPYGKIVDPGKLREEMVAELRRWIEANKPKDAPPKSSKGDVIRKVRLRTTDKVAVAVRDGTADRGEMARVDVFAKAKKRGKREFYLVPIYPHQVANQKKWPLPPNKAVVAAKAEEDWVTIDDSFDFLFSLYIHSLIAVTKADGEIISGYFKGLSRSTGAISIAPHENQRQSRPGIGAKTLLGFQKLVVDRLGRRTEVIGETRTWHGEACI